MMELRPEHLKQITCEVVLFNRQKWKISNRKIKRVVYDFSGKVTIIKTDKLVTYQDLYTFFNQIKLIYLDGKIVACRGCSELPLKISNIDYSKMKSRQKLLLEAKKSYSEWKKEQYILSTRK
ncbi:type III secretion system protein PrgR [Enterococcus hirae]|nr:type III secretion system protein PrgR [Enterococcus hirae]EMF0574950.1 type III secretion system protein PrgR [Enterococcus hirae]